MHKFSVLLLSVLPFSLYAQDVEPIDKNNGDQIFIKQATTLGISPLIPIEFFHLLLPPRYHHEMTYLYFEHYMMHANILLERYLRNKPKLEVNYKSRHFIRTALMAVLIAVKYGEDDSVYLSDLVYALQIDALGKFSFKELKRAEIEFVKTIGWNFAFKPDVPVSDP